MGYGYVYRDDIAYSLTNFKKDEMVFSEYAKEHLDIRMAEERISFYQPYVVAIAEAIPMLVTHKEHFAFRAAERLHEGTKSALRYLINMLETTPIGEEVLAYVDTLNWGKSMHGTMVLYIEKTDRLYYIHPSQDVIYASTVICDRPMYYIEQDVCLCCLKTDGTIESDIENVSNIQYKDENWEGQPDDQK